MTVGPGARRVVERFPLACSALIEAGNLQQIWRMWREHSALGQSLGGWLAIHLALWLWLAYFCVCLPPEQRLPRRIQALGVLINGAVCLSVVWWRYVA